MPVLERTSGKPSPLEEEREAQGGSSGLPCDFLIYPHALSYPHHLFYLEPNVLVFKSAQLTLRGGAGVGGGWEDTE